MNLPVLSPAPECTACVCHQSASSRGLAPITLNPSQPDALLFIGLFPGKDEDAAGEAFVGPSGQLLRNAYLRSYDLISRATIYLTNAIRCHPGPSKPPASAYTTCESTYLPPLISHLTTLHTRLAIICLGAAPSQYLYKKAGIKSPSLNKAISRPNTPLPPWNVPLFATYNPAQLIDYDRGRPVLNGLQYAVADHLALVSRYLSGTLTAPTLSRPTIIPAQPPP